MGRKLLYYLLLVFSIVIISENGYSQACPTSVSISAAEGRTICENTQVTFNSSVTGGSNLIYQWQINGTDVGTTQTSFSTSTLQNNDEVRLIVTSSDDANCEIPSQPIKMTVNSIRQGSVVIQADKNPVCPGGNINFSISSITEAGTNPVYDWRVNNSSVGNNSTLNTSLNDGDQVQLFISSSNPCTDDFLSNQITISEKPASPGTPSAITGSITVCPGTSETYSISTVNNAISYQWELPNGWSGSSSSTSITLTTGSSDGTIKVIAIGECSNSEQSINVTVQPDAPGQLGNISGNESVCPGVNETYSIAAIANAETYEWTFPSGWGTNNTITTSTPEATINTGNSGSGQITVKAINSCGESATRNLAVNVEAGTPGIPGTIIGAIEVCPGTSETYTINAISGTEEYIWNFPSSWGMQEQITTTPQISIQTGQSGSGNIAVAARNSCGTSASQSLAIQMQDGAPTNAGSISINFSNSNNVICPGDQIEFSVSALAEVEEYIWSIPTGWNITGTETGNSITVNAGNYGENGLVSVVPKNSCGQGTASSLSVSVDAPTPEIGTVEITGPQTVCSNATQLQYSIPLINHATSYEWSLPSGWAITSGQNTNNIEVSASGTSGNIEVFAKNDCGASSVVFKTITSTTAVPEKPLAISSNLPSTAICPPFNNVEFWIDEVENTEEYLWSLPNGWNIVSGAGTTNITVNITANSNYSANESVSVQAINICGASASETMGGIAIDDYVVTDLGEDMVLCSLNNTIIIDAYVAFGSKNAKLKIDNIETSSGTQIDPPSGKVDSFKIEYIPTASDINNGQVTISVTTEKPGGACNAGEDEMTIFFREDPQASFTTTGQDICENSSTQISLTGTPETRITYTENGNSKTIDLDANGEAGIITGNLTSSTTFQLISSQYLEEPLCENSLSGTHEVIVNPVPFADLVYTQAAFCEDDTEIKQITLENPIGAIENGVFTATPAGLSINENSGAINPENSNPGEYLITYIIPPTLGCERVELTTNISITAVPQVSLSYEDTHFCSSDENTKTVTLNGSGNYENGTFAAGTGLQIDSETGEINPSTSNPGTYQVTYTTPESAGCGTYNFTTEIIITEAPNPTIAYPATEVCNSETAAFVVELTGNNNSQSGTFSAGNGLELNATTGTITPTGSDPGTYTVTYTTPEINGCAPAITETSITITELPSAEINYNTPICASETELQQVSFSNTIGNYTNGTFTSSPTGLSIDSQTGAINPSLSDPEIYSITYTIMEQGGCEAVIINTSVAITEVPYATISYENASLCTSVTQDQPVTFINTPTEYQDGTFSGSNGLAISADGNIDPASSNSGSHTVFYSIPAKNSCDEVVTSLEIEIFEKPQITSQPFNIGICTTQPSELSVSAIGDDLSYQWYQDGNAVSGATSATLNFSNTTSVNAGEYYVVITGAQSCSEVTSDTVSLNVDEDIIIEEPVKEVPICGDGFSEVNLKFIAHANGAPLTFTWYKGNTIVDDTDANITITTQPADENGKYEGILEIINVTTAYNGDYYVEIQGPSEFTCSTAVTNPFQLRLNEIPEQPTVEKFEYCQFENAPALTVVSGTNLTWYASENGDDAFSTQPIPNTDAPGETIYWVTQTPDVCESERVAVSVNIKEKPLTPETTALLEYCEGETANTLEATTTNGAILNWYDEDSNALTAAPTPDTAAPGTYLYYVSQSLEACESDKVTIEVIIHELPEVTITPSETLVCAASTVILTAVGADSYIWYNEADEEIGTADSLEINPETTTTYTVIGTSTGDCSSEAEITIQVDQPSDAGTITGETNVCIGNNSGEISVANINGEVIRWEYSEDNESTWETVNQEASEISTSYTYENLILSTSFRAVVQNGICDETTSESVNIQVDEYPVGGELNFQGFDRLYTTCQDPEFLEDLVLTGHTGEVVAWKYRTAQGSFQTIAGETGTTLSAAVIGNLLGNETLIFQAEVINGACSEPLTSRTAILSIISSDIEPAPVSVSEDLICLGDEVTLTAESGYESGDGINDRGNFNNASIDQHGWRIKDSDGNLENFESSANNVRPNVWKRVTPREFITANLSSPYNTSLQLFDHGLTSGNKGFAIVSGTNSSTMETNVFALDGMDSGILTFDQAYNLTPGASIEVLISTSGGAAGSYTQLYNNNNDPSSGNYANFSSGNPTSRPENKMEIDLGDYIGQNNLRIMFKFTGVRDGDVWAVDNIILPDGPQDVGVIWEDTTNPETPVVIGTNFSEQWTPTEIGWNVSVITTTLEYTGGSCPTARNDEEIKVFVYDQYTTSITAETGNCGVYSAELTATVSSAAQGVITSYPTADGYIGKWNVEGPDENFEFSNIDPNDTTDPITNPNAIFTSESQNTENYIFTWILEPTETDENGNLIENQNCLPIYEPLEIAFEACTALDFDGIDDYVDLGETYTGNYTLEAWIRPQSSTGTILSGPNFEINMEDLPAGIYPNTRWYHIAVSNNKLYIDGIEEGSFNIGNSGTKTLIGARWNNGTPENHFDGWIEEVRIWNSNLTIDQIRFMMNQRLYNNGTQMGVEIPMNVPGGLSYTSLAGYYQLLADPVLVAMGTTPDLASTSVPGRLVNMDTFQENTAPLPYTSRVDGQTWATDNTWTHFDVWDAPNSNGIDGSPIDWNIVRTSHDIDSGNKDIIVLGLKSETGTLDIFNPSGVHNETNSGQYLRVSHYLKLNGVIDLTGESQLIQDIGSIVDAGSSGYLERDQQGTANSYNYNYWSFPVSAGASNSGGSIKNLLKDGTDSNNAKDISFAYDHTYADNYNYTAGPKRISAYWLFKFFGTANIYAEWKWIGENGLLNAGDGFTMKGTSGNVAISTPQNYVFKGLPNNGPVSGVSIGTNQNRLIGNPYPSAMEAKQFILDNLDKNIVSGATNTQNIFNGALYFWDHFGPENTHILREYVGGYATINLSGAVKSASSVDERINNDGSSGTKEPGQFVPVGQGFFINTVLDPAIANGITINGGTVNFNNGQRAFVTELNSNESQFLKPIYPTKEKTKVTTKDSRYKIKLNFTSPIGFQRQILVTADANTTNGFDLGYDALLIDDIPEDMYWLIQDNEFVIQAVPDFNIDQVLPLGIKIKEEVAFSVEIGELKNYPDTQPVYLKDKIHDSIHDLRSGAYFATSESGTHNERFEIVFRNKNELEKPVKPKLNNTVDFVYYNDTRELIISNPDLVNISEILIFDLNGRVLKTYDDIPTEKETTINIRSRHASVYIIKLITEMGSRNKKFIMNLE
ncbi:Concanavalin A-like lectin/glucanases superfamily protein [Salegentibacter holothuriorum]|uniref:Concanavalin A-like lectin/glucanases superfamily protein n=1 Tax=Salegentibacter holothuriorum TaxID=241145 RepID=A0A1T5E630_9FLAO|nr:LamG-like jellyroll fold domain-containing protein [Salegentibacter holothuriorum]SKB79522.1 Concanavalin A-like lectin/glucanases superfamily protein [Salegentibacter holothuriorum]